MSVREREVRNCRREPGIVSNRGNSANFTILRNNFYFQSNTVHRFQEQGVISIIAAL
jgi:hypothetical protein